MSAENAYFSELDESLRRNYLDAMEVPVWSPRVELEQESNLTIEDFKKEDALKEEQGPEEHVVLKENNGLKENSGLKEEKPTKPTDATLKQNKPASQLAGQFLKLFNAQAATESDKKILIVCRHNKDQPAQSFVTNHRPSQLMQDYLQAIKELLMAKDNNMTVNIQLAQLVEAALSDDCYSVDHVIQNKQPDLILLLGDESIRSLLKEQTDLAQIRGKLFDIETTQTLVSYHPYTLIQNPQLKKLALEDLGLIASLLQKTVD